MYLADFFPALLFFPHSSVSSSQSIKNTRRITEAMRLVAAARVRRAQEAVLKTRPLLAQLQLVR